MRIHGLRLFLPVLAALCLTAGPAASQPDPSAAVAAALGGRAVAPGPTALLVGLGSAEGYRTILVADDGTGARRAGDVPFIVSPQPDGFRFVQAGSASSGTGCGDQICGYEVTLLSIATAPQTAEALNRQAAATIKDERQAALASPAGAAGFLQLTERLDFVANGFACFDVDGIGYSGGAHPYHLDDRSCRPIDEPLWPAVLDTALLPADRLAAVRDALRAEDAAGHIEEIEGVDLPMPQREGQLSPFDLDQLHFRLGRDQGMTRMTVTAHADAAYAWSSTYRFTVAAPAGPAPAEFVPFNPPNDAFGRLKQSRPDLVDLFLPPAGGFAGLLFPDRLEIVEVATGRTLLREAVAFDRVVMVEWATGRHVAAWVQAVEAAD